MTNTTILKEVVATILGRKYWANIVATRGTNEVSICSFIFRTKAEALRHRDDLRDNRSFQYIETITFRSREEY